MTVRKLALLLSAPIFVAACGDKSQPAAPAANPSQAATASQPEVSRTDENSEKAQSIALPKPGDVLQAIYQKDSHGEDTVTTANGSQATYWYGHRFTLSGKQYFTGFAYDMPDQAGDQKGPSLPDPAGKVALTAATFELAQSGAAPKWSVVGAERSIGEFGGYEKADEVDDKEAAQSMSTSDGRIVLAVPTWYLATGVRIKSFSIFIYRPAPSSDKGDTHWIYAGNAYRGEDNDAACDADGTGNHIPCAASSATLAFDAAGTSDLPRLRVTLKGTGIDDAGNKKTYGAADVAEYRFNPQTKAYEVVKR